VAGEGVGGLRCFDTLPLARALFAESARLGDLAHRFDIPVGRAHHAADDAVTLARVLGHLGAYKLARSRKSALVNLLDLVGLALATAEDPDPTPERRLLREISRPYVLGRYSDALEYYAAERERLDATDAPTVDEVIDRFGGRKALLRYRTGRSTSERYPASVARLTGLVAASAANSLAGGIARLLEHVALSTSEGVEADPQRVNLLTLHSTKGLEFSRVYVVGVEDYQLPGYYAAIENRRHEIEEARRLLYVGMTRAMDRLVMTRVGARFGKPAGGSLFLEEMGLATPVPVE
jgi:UvrD-like helicase family protein